MFLIKFYYKKGKVILKRFLYIILEIKDKCLNEYAAVESEYNQFVYQGVIEELQYQYICRHKSKRRLAIVSPLPPDKSGIADYTVELMSSFDDKYEIDLYSDIQKKYIDGRNVYPWEHLRKTAFEYGLIIYQMGNSEFHYYMLELMLKYPGLLVLHDFYLSGMMSYISFVQKKSLEDFRFHLRYSHKVGCDCSNIEEMCIKYPMNKMLIDYSLGVIFHSQYSMRLYKDFYGEKTHPKFYHIPQIHRVVNDKNKKMDIREELGLDQNVFLIITLGFASPFKYPELFEQVANKLSAESKYLFVYVGDVSKEIANNLTEKKNIYMTGYVEADVYEKYIAAADVAVQLRSQTRGETSRAVLDCLAYSLPVIVNDYATFKDYPDDVVYKISEKPTVQELYDAIIGLMRDKSKLNNLSVKANRYFREYHSPEIVKEKYYDCIEDVIKNKEKTSRSIFVNDCRKHGFSDKDLKKRVKEFVFYCMGGK